MLAESTDHAAATHQKGLKGGVDPTGNHFIDLEERERLLARSTTTHERRVRRPRGRNAFVRLVAGRPFACVGAAIGLGAVVGLLIG